MEMESKVNLSRQRARQERSSPAEHTSSSPSVGAKTAQSQRPAPEESVVSPPFSWRVDCRGGTFQNNCKLGADADGDAVKFVEGDSCFEDERTDAEDGVHQYRTETEAKLAAMAADDAARAAAVAKSHAVAEQARWARHVSTKQFARVAAHRAQQQQQAEAADAKKELAGQLEAKLRRRLAGKPFIAVLRELGVPLDGSAPSTHCSSGGIGATKMHKAYRRALSIYHPDRAVQRQQSWQQVVEAEEIYKLLQTLYEQHAARQLSRQKLTKP